MPLLSACRLGVRVCVCADAPCVSAARSVRHARALGPAWWRGVRSRRSSGAVVYLLRASRVCAQAEQILSVSGARLPKKYDTQEHRQRLDGLLLLLQRKPRGA